MAGLYNYFGFYYDFYKDNSKRCRLDSATSAKGRVIIPDYVESNGEKYKVVSVVRSGYAYMREKPSDKRIKDISKYPLKNLSSYSPFTCNYRDELDIDRALPPNNTVTYVKLPDTVTLLGATFRRCYALEEVILPKGITVIGGKTFSECRALKSIQLHEGITIIGSEAFAGCSAMKEITIPSTVTKIDEKAFNDTYQNKSGLEVVNNLNDEGAVLMYPNSFTDRVKINYLGKNGAKKIAKTVTEKPEKVTPKATATPKPKPEKVEKAAPNIKETPQKKEKTTAEKTDKVADTDARQMWVSRSTEQLVALGEKIVSLVNKSAATKYELRYTNSYIGLGCNGKPSNFAWFIPRKKDIQLSIKVKQSADFDKVLDKTFAGNWAYKNDLYCINTASGIESLVPVLQAAEKQFKK